MKKRNSVASKPFIEVFVLDDCFSWIALTVWMQPNINNLW